jgi:2-polyprenyl-3-methyl-5-hydroxy-6-metoxy-1,4-benzoquinol methylase
VDWTTLSDDPTSAVVKRALYTELRARRGPHVSDKTAFLREFATGHSVLDVGVVSHSLSHVDLPTWLHGQLRDVARELVGVDILEEQVAELRARGFDVHAIDATSDANLGRRFERVIMGDLIEHVENPVALLRFGARHLDEGGLILVTTPNPLYFGHAYESLRTGVVLNNAEHISYVAPVHALELARRAGLELREYRHLQLPFSEAQTWRQKVLFFVRDRLAPTQELFAHAFVYIFAKAPG